MEASALGNRTVTSTLAIAFTPQKKSPAAATLVKSQPPGSCLKTPETSYPSFRFKSLGRWVPNWSR